MKTIISLCIAVAIMLSSCAKEEVTGDTMKITYRVNGSDYNALLVYPNGERELVYNQTGVFKRYSHVVVGDPIYILAYGCDDIVVSIIIEGVLDTIRRANAIGTELVVIDSKVDEQ
jgi:hypothetical protein